MKKNLVPSFSAKLRTPFLSLMGILIAVCITLLTIAPVSSSPAWRLFLPILLTDAHPTQMLYQSSNLAGHSIFAECNPGGTSQCPCTDAEAAIQTFDSYGTVTSNPRGWNTYINAIGFKKFTENYPDGSPIRLDRLRYHGQIRLPTLPAPDVAQTQNPQAVHFMMQFWDGRNALFQANHFTREGVLYWDLNPWKDADYGKIKIYTNPVVLADTGIIIPPDTQWHTFELIIDLNTQRYVSAQIDNQRADLSSYELARVYQPGWGQDLSLSITTESMASWPGEGCPYIFTWTTQFRNLTFERFE